MFKKHVYGCFFDDKFGMKVIEDVGENNITFETDYPHSDSTWPHSAKIAAEQTADITPEQRYKVLRGNAIEMLDLEQFRAADAAAGLSG